MSWDQLTVIAVEAAAWKLRERSEPPLACPNDGEPLRAGPGGGSLLFCPFDGYEWPRMPRII